MTDKLKHPLKVKPLVFEDRGGWWFAPKEAYSIISPDGQAFELVGKEINGGPAIFDTFEEAEQAAQDDWRKFILSAIEE